MPEPRKIVGLALTLLACISLVGCVGIPTNSGVSAGQVASEEGLSDTDFLPQEPVAGSDQQAILTGFMDAALGPQGNYAVATHFLTDDFANVWNPNASVLVHSGSPVISRVSDSTLDYSIDTVAEVDPDGRYAAVPPAPAQNLLFEFAQNSNGEWRISKAPDGVVLSEENFRLVFSTQALYFFDSTFEYLVPDVRWFPSRGAVSRRVVGALLGGQSDWLGQGATVSAVPDGVRLVSVRAPDGGVVQVDLSPDFLAASELDKQRLRLQLTSSLGTVPNVQTVEITVGQVPVNIPDPGSVVAEQNPSVDPRPAVLSDGQFGYDAGNGIEPIGALSAKIAALEPNAVTLARAGSVAAVRAPDGGVYGVRAGGGDAVLLDSRAGLVAPSADNSGYIWSMPAADPAGITVYEPNGTPHTVGSTLPADALVSAMKVSRDGARILFSLMTGAGPRLVVAGIIRDNGLPIALGALFDLPVGTQLPTDVTWMDARSVATITGSGGQTVAMRYEIGGKSTTLPAPDDAVAIVGGNNGTAGLRVLTTTGAIIAQRGSSWGQETGTIVSLLATQQ